MATDVKIILSAEDRTKATIEGMIGRLTDMNSAASLVRGGLAQLGAGLTVGAMVAFAKATIDGIDALNDLKAATGSSIENISALEDVAKRTGTSFDTVGSALIKFNKLLNDAKPGSDAEAALKALNLNIEELKTLDPAEAMRQTAVALSGFADDGNKGRLMLELFGKSTRDVAKFLQDLAEQQKLVATVTTEAAAEAEKFNNELSTLKKNVEDGARVITSSLVTSINAAIERFREGAREGKNFYQVIIDQQLRLLGLRSGPNEDAARLDEINALLATNTLHESRRNALLREQAAIIAKLPKSGMDDLPQGEAPKLSLPATVGGKVGSGSKPPTPANAYESINASLDRYLALNKAAASAEQDLSATERMRISTLAEITSKYVSNNLTIVQFMNLQDKLKKVVDAGLAAEALDKARKDAAASYKSTEAAAAAYNKTLADGNLSAERAVQAAEDELNAIGLLKSGVQALTLAKMQAQLEAGNLTQAETNSLNLRIDAQKRLIGATQALEATKTAQDRQGARNAEYEGIRQFIADQEAAAFATAATAEATAAAARAELDNFGKTKSQLAEITLLRLQDKQVNLTAGTDLYAATQRQIEAQKELIATLKTGEARDTATKSAQDRQAARNDEYEAVQQFIQNQELAAQTAARTAVANTAAAQAEFDAFGKTKTQLAEITLLRLQDSQANLTAGTVAFDSLQRQIDAQKELIGILQKGEARDIALDAADKAAKAWRQAADSINASLTDALMRGFEGGKDSAQNFADTLENMIKTAILRPLLAKVLDPISLAISAGMNSVLGLPSLEGGGYTGPGLRTGGLDGRGGFMAMLHPNETVIDHTQGGSAGAGQSVTVVQNFTVGDVASVSLVRQAVANSERRIASTLGRSMNYGGAIA